MRDKAVYLFVFDGFADWEPAHALPELRRHGHYSIETVGLTSEPVTSMGGMRVLPSKALADVDPAQVAVFILPGGDRWQSEPIEPELEGFLKKLDAGATPIAGICAASLVMPKLGLLRGRRHTSNGLSYLKQYVPAYADEANYVDVPAVRDGGLITASGLADVEFARELFEELDVLKPEQRAMWAKLFRAGRVPSATA
jgi:putative intracellular protease/amidase